MRSYLFALLALSADAALDSSAATLAAATTTVTIGSSSQYWSAMPSSPSSYSIAVGDKLKFQYNSNHNLYQMASAAKYASCDFTGATELASKSQGGGSGGTPNLYEAVVTSADTLYFACRIGGHCQMDQKVTITAASTTSPSPSPPSPSPPPPSPSPLPSPPPSPSPPPPSPSPPVSVAATAAGCAAALGDVRTVVPFQNVPLSQPTALAWHPTQTSELWVTDAASDSLTVLDTSSGATRQLGDRAPYHYMARVSSISFDSVGQFATCQESINTYEGQMPANFFMGPTLYDSRSRGFTNSRQEVRRTLSAPLHTLRPPSAPPPPHALCTSHMRPVCTRLTPSAPPPGSRAPRRRCPRASPTRVPTTASTATRASSSTRTCCTRRRSAWASPTTAPPLAAAPKVALSTATSTGLTTAATSSSCASTLRATTGRARWTTRSPTCAPDPKGSYH